jgi:hypothetical protein
MSTRLTTPSTLPLGWREIALRWRAAHAPSTSYERLVRSSQIEMGSEEREAVRKDIRRSNIQPEAHITADFDPEAHAARLERVLCAWAQYDQEVCHLGCTRSDTTALTFPLLASATASPSQLCSRAIATAPSQIGYVQAINLVASTLLMLLDADEEVRAMRSDRCPDLTVADHGWPTFVRRPSGYWSHCSESCLPSSTQEHRCSCSVSGPRWRCWPN